MKNLGTRNDVSRLNGKTLIAQAVRDMDLSNATRRMDAMEEWVFEAEVLIGSNESYLRKECELDVENYRAALPKDFYKLIAVKKGDQYFEYTGRDFKLFNKGAGTTGFAGIPSNTPPPVDNQGGTTEFIESNQSSNLADRRSNDSLHNLNNPVINNLPKFYLADGYLNVTMPDGNIGVAYRAYPLDSEGVPMVHPNHAEAVTAYLIYKYFQAEWIKGKISQGVFGELKNRWLELCRNARGRDNMPSRREMDHIGYIWNNLKMVTPPNQIN